MPVGGSPTDETIRIWLAADSRGGGRLKAITSVVLNAHNGMVIGVTRWPDSQGRLLEESGFGVCNSISPPTVTSAWAVVNDSVGPIPFEVGASFATAPKSLRELVSRQGPLLVTVRQTGTLASRIVDEFAEPSGVLVARITKVALSNVSTMPSARDLLRRCRES